MAPMIYHDRISDIIREHYGHEIIDNVDTKQTIIRTKTSTGKTLAVAVDNFETSSSINPQKIIYEAHQKLEAARLIEEAHYVNQQQQNTAARAQNYSNSMAGLQNAMNNSAYNYAAQAAQNQSNGMDTFSSEPNQKIYGNLISNQPRRHGKLGSIDGPYNPTPLMATPKLIEIKRTKYHLGTMGLFTPFKNFFKDMWKLTYAN